MRNFEQAPGPAAEWFAQPGRTNQEILRAMGYAVVDAIVDGILPGDRPFVAETSPFPWRVPTQGRSYREILPEVMQELVPRALNVHHPGYRGHMDSVPLMWSVWGDALIAALHNNLLSAELSPGFTPLEAQGMNWFGQQFGLGENAFGTLMAGGSLANLTALLVARQARFPDVKDRGWENLPAVALVSAAAHTSFRKAANAIGLGRDRLRLVPTDAQGRMRPQALAAALEQAQAQGQIPFFVGAVAGTTVTGAIDPLPEIAAIARQFGCWFHVDAAYGGAVQFSPTWRHLLTGCEQADSLTFNPQKWLWVSRTCAMLLLRDRRVLEETFDRDLPYMDETRLNFGNLTLQGTRRTDILKLWLVLQSTGLTGLAGLIDRTMALAHRWAAAIAQEEEAEVVCPPTLNIVCVRPRREPPKVLRDRWQRERGWWLSLPRWQGETLLKAVFLHPFGDTAKPDRS
ncbi:MAG: aminotransferase class V-fold PLP-dependent enzyme [Pseudanabaenaceae cyanobacterium]